MPLKQRNQTKLKRFTKIHIGLILNVILKKKWLTLDRMYEGISMHVRVYKGISNKKKINF